MVDSNSSRTVISAQSSRSARYLNPLHLVRNLWRHRHLISQFTRREIESQYKESFLGLLWAVLTPLILLVMYTFVFGIVFHRRWIGDNNGSLEEFALVLFCGLTVFNIFSEPVNRASRLIVGMPNYVKKVVFPLEILPLSTLGSALFHSCMRMAVLLVASLVINNALHWTLILLPVVLLPIVLLSLGISWFLASLGVFFRDLHQGVSLVVQALFFFSPILYPIEAVPASFQPIMQLNPLTSVVDNARRVILWGQLPQWESIVVWVPLAGIVMLLGYLWFMNTKKAFADVI